MRDLKNEINYINTGNKDFSVNVMPYSTDRGSYATTADNFTDEENPSFMEVSYEENRNYYTPTDTADND